MVGRVGGMGSVKLLVVGPDIRDFRKVKNFTGIQAFYLARELRARGVQLHFVDGKHPDPLSYLAGIDGCGCDHALALGLRWFTHKPIGCASILATKVKGSVTQLHDGVVHEYLEPHLADVDCTFTFRDDSTRTKHWERYARRYHFIGWAADPNYLYPEQKPGELRILIDHPYYKSGTPDITDAVTTDAVMFANTYDWRDSYKTIRIRRLINGGAEDVNMGNLVTKQFDRKHVPFEDIAQEYRRTTVYLVTHKESVGLTCLELAYCGALVVASKGLIYQDRLDTVRHILYEGVRAPWNIIMAEIAIAASAALARKQRWGDVATRMLQWFEDYK